MSEKNRKLLVLGLATLVMMLAQWALSSCNADPDHCCHDCPAEVTTENITGSEDLGGADSDVMLVDFEDSLSHEEVLAYGERFDLDLKPHISEPVINRNLYLTRVPEGAVPRMQAHILAHYDSVVQSVSEEHSVKGLLWEPNDPLRQFQWHFDQIALGEAWTLSTGRGSVVAVIDSGVSLDRDDKREPIRDFESTDRVTGWDFVDGTDFAWDGGGHGTHVAGTIAQTTDNKYGGSGIAYHASLMNVRVLDTSGRGKTSDVVAGIYFAADNGAHVINMSLGSSRPTPAMQEACTYAHNQGVTVVAAAGNSGKRQPSYPAAYDHVVSVAATQYDRHPTPYSQWGPKVDIAAPGGNTKLDQNEDGKPDGVLQETVKQGRPNDHYFALYQGTSMASPHVAGVAALINQWGVTHPDLVEKYLTRGADESRLLREDGGEPDESGFFAFSDDKKEHYPLKEFRERYGSGIVQADSAVTAAILEPGLLRLLLSLALASLLFVLSRQQSLLEADTKLLGAFLGSSALAASGLFFLPLIVPGMEIESVSFAIQILATPILALDWVVLGIGQTPLLGSAILPVLVLLATHHLKVFKYVGAGLAVGMASYLVAEMVLLTSPLMWLPGGDFAARAFYLLNAVLVAILTFFSLSGEIEEPDSAES